ncbi:hypothetical protein ACQEWB_09550 [Streptomyces sp. CA-249302]
MTAVSAAPVRLDDRPGTSRRPVDVHGFVSSPSLTDCPPPRAARALGLRP